MDKKTIHEIDYAKLAKASIFCKGLLFEVPRMLEMFQDNIGNELYETHIRYIYDTKVMVDKVLLENTFNGKLSSIFANDLEFRDKLSDVLTVYHVKDLMEYCKGLGYVRSKSILPDYSDDNMFDMINDIVTILFNYLSL